MASIVLFPGDRCSPQVIARILFIDDDPTLLTGLKRVLHRKRTVWDMTFVLGGEAALVELAAATYDLVVTDLRMPVVDGLAVLDALDRIAPQTLRVVLTGSDGDAVADRVDAVLVKPCSASMLEATIDRLLQRGGDSAEQAR